MFCGPVEEDVKINLMEQGRLAITIKEVGKRESIYLTWWKLMRVALDRSCVSYCFLRKCETRIWCKCDAD
jgi:hypothetical protein